MGTILAHITDAHVDPRGRRNATLKDLSVDILHDLVEQVDARAADATIFGGDNIDNGHDGEADLQAFLRVADRLERWYCIFGNHEAKDSVPGSRKVSKERFAASLTGHGIAPGRSSWADTLGDVRLIGIDTTLRGTGGGHVSQETMSFLAAELRDAVEEHIVVVGHHLLARPWAPYRLDVWDGEYLVENRDQVISLLARFPRVRAYLCGHHHASRIHRIAGRGDSGGFYHILTASPVAYPHTARLLRFEHDALVVETIRPRIEGVVEEGQRAILTGRKAARFASLGSAESFSDYVRGGVRDNDVRLPYAPDQRLGYPEVTQPFVRVLGRRSDTAT